MAAETTTIRPADVRQVGAPGTQSSGWAKGVRYALLILFAAMVLLPLYVLIVTSLKDRGDISPATASRGRLRGCCDRSDSGQSRLG